MFETISACESALSVYFMNSKQISSTQRLVLGFLWRQVSLCDQRDLGSLRMGASRTNVLTILSCHTTQLLLAKAFCALQDVVRTFIYCNLGNLQCGY